MVLTYKDTMDYSKIIVSSPVKDNKEWNCNIAYMEQPLLIQTPRIKFDKELNVLTFKLRTKKEFIEFLENVENGIVQYISKNSKELFSGKIFSDEKIKSCLQSSWDIDDTGYVYIKPGNVSFDDVVCYDIFNKRIEFSEVGHNITALLHVKSVSFSKNLFRVNYIMKQLKISKFEENKTLEFGEEPEKQNVRENDDLNFFD